MSTIYFVYDQQRKPEITATFDGKILVPVTVKKSPKTGVIELDPIWLQDKGIVFGTQNLTIESNDWINKCVVTVYFEEDLEGLEVGSYAY